MRAAVHAMRAWARRCVIAAWAAGVLHAGPRPAAADELAESVPPGYVRRPSHALVVAGSVLFASVYATNLVAVLGNDIVRGSTRENWLAAPGIGPIVLMAQTRNVPGNLVLAADALAQGSGIAMLVYGLVARPTVLVREEGGLRLTLTPVLGAGRAGLGLAGVF